MTAKGGLGKVVLVAADGSRAEIHTHGAHVTSWIPAGDIERLFLSERSEFEPGSAIRGGVPVIFPQFANEGPLPKHGFARNVPWHLVSCTPNVSAVAEATFHLGSSPATEAVWPHAFEAELAVVVQGRSLELTLRVANTGSTPFTFTAALHTYLRVHDARETRVRGLRGCTYRDATAGGVHREESAEWLPIVGEVNRIYFDVRSPVTVEDNERSTVIDMEGFPDVVVWNPGPVGGAALSDLEPDGYLRMLCVEAAAIRVPVTLERGDRWSGRQRLLAR